MERAEEQLDKMRLLVTGAAAEAISQGVVFAYEGAELLAEDVAEICVAPLLVITQRLSESLGLGSLGMRFRVQAIEGQFPLKVEPTCELPFLRVGPLLYESFVSCALRHHACLEKLYAEAARVLGLVVRQVRPGATPVLTPPPLQAVG